MLFQYLNTAIKNKVQILIWYIAIILYLGVFTVSDVNSQWYHSGTTVIAVAWTVADLGLRQPLICFEIKSLDIYPDLNLDSDVYEQA